MKFEIRPLNESIGWSLAHSIRANDKRWPKGTILTDHLVTDMSDQGIKSAQVFILEQDDIDEDTATLWIAEKIAGTNIKCVAAGKGRANLIALADGVFMPNAAIESTNQLDDAFSVACLAAYSVVTKNQLVATIKLVPYGIDRRILADSKQNNEKAYIAAFSPFSVSLIYTGPSPTCKTIETLTQRLKRLKGTVSSIVSAEHTIQSVTSALLAETQNPKSMIMLLGESAISDLRDILPSALIASGGNIIKLGMPTDPGNLLMLGDMQGTPVIGLPGCARSPALNGFDWILERLAAEIVLDHASITSLGVGGLLKEHVNRPVPRYQTPPPKGSSDGFAALILAAGKATRARGINKLLSNIGTATVIEQSISKVFDLKPDQLITIIGHASDNVSTALKNIETTLIRNPDFENGMGSSLACGIRALPESIRFCMVCLGDMPFIQPSTYTHLKKTALSCEPESIIIPTFHGKRGHPVIWPQRFFAELGQLSGDRGGKAILEANRDRVIEVAVEDTGILIDLDTPEMLAHFGVIPKDQQ
jgi:molybdenum cofactor cytidylyltransferase